MYLNQGLKILLIIQNPKYFKADKGVSEIINNFVTAVDNHIKKRTNN